MDTNEQGHAIPFISFVNKKGFVLTKEAEDFLHSLEGSHIGVISVVGKYRTGKSFFVNRVLLNTQNEGFTVGPTINPCTKGLWLWSKTLKSNNPEHENMKVILIDTEGFGGMDENSNHDTRIFLFALLLSSFFIYNSTGSIDENALNNLSLIVNLAKEIQVSSGPQGSSPEEDVSQYFPSFLWIVRDFALKLIDLNGQPISSKEYLENALAPQKGVSDAVESKNRIRRMLKHFFRDRDCYTMVRPLENESELQGLDKMSDEELRPEFVGQVNDVRTKIFKKVKPKSLNGKLLTGSMLVEITKAYVEGINSGKVPNIESAWTYVCKEQSRKAIGETVNLLEQKLGQLSSEEPLNEKELKECKKMLREEMLTSFQKSSMGESEELKVFTEELDALFNERFASFKKRNTQKWKESLMNWLTTNSTVEASLKNDSFKNYFEFKAELEKLEQKFEKEASNGINKEQIWKEYSQSMFALAAETLSKKAEEQYSGENRVLTQRLELLEKELGSKKKDYEVEREQLHMQIQQIERDRGYLKANENSTKETIESLKAQKEKYEKMYNEAIEKGRDREDKTEKENRSKVSELESKLEKARGEILLKTVDLEKRNALLEQEIVFIKRDNEEIKRKCENVEQEKKEIIKELKQKETIIDDLKKELSQGSMGKQNEISQLKLELERKINEIQQEDEKKKGTLKQEQEWQMEKFNYEKQIQFLTLQMEETKKLQHGLLSAIEHGRSGNDSEGNQVLAQTNKNLSAALEKMEARTKHLEDKLEKLKKYKHIVLNASALQCAHCSKFISCNIFPQHMKNCITEKSTTTHNFMKTLTPTSQPSQWNSPTSHSHTSSHGSHSNHQIEQYSIQIAINQTAVKEGPDAQPYTEYMIQVTYNGIKWLVPKQYKAFLELHQGLSAQLSNLKFPESAFTILGSFSNSNYTPNTKKHVVIEERRKNLEQYLRDLAKIDVVRNNLLFQRFLGLDQASKNINSHPLITQRLNLTSYRDESRKFESSSNSRQNLEEENSNVDQMSQTLKADQTSRSREPLNIFAITSPKAMGVRNLPPQSPKTFINVWADKPDSKENKVPRSRGTSEDPNTKGVMQHLVKDSYRPHHAHLHLNNLVTGRFLSNTPTKFMGDSTMDQPSENRIPRPQMDLPTKGHNNTKSWALNGQATDRSALGQTDIFPNKAHTKGSKSIGRIRPSTRYQEESANTSGNLNNSSKINSNNNSYYQTFLKEYKNR